MALRFASLVKKLRPVQVTGISRYSSFKASNLEIELTKNPKEIPNADDLVFGQNFSDHMLEIDWTESEGWTRPKISEIRNFSMHPATKVLHYAIELFEGMKAYRGYDNVIRLFRPDKNMERMKTTALRSNLPDFDGEELIECIKKLIAIDSDWVPKPNPSSCSQSSTLYIRPTMIGTDPHLGVSKSTSAKLFVIAGPVGPYYKTGFKPISLLADPQFVRATIGGTGGYKMGCNYAPTIYIQNLANKKHNCQQVLWLYGKDEQMTEVGTMNIFMMWTNEKGVRELVTPPLSQGIILPGVTRLSLLELAKQWGEFNVSERIITMKDLVNGLKDNRVEEVFGAGTACIVSPVDRVLYQNKWLEVPTMEVENPTYGRLLKNLTDIQFGKAKSPWMIEVPEISDRTKLHASQ
ncbi:DgyrCDS3480 [Dimorphilus gyrociliatus]|nr:DgyrCDS3480 [Dimorphilus gyrociliatus]